MDKRRKASVLIFALETKISALDRYVRQASYLNRLIVLLTESDLPLAQNTTPKRPNKHAPFVTPC